MNEMIVVSREAVAAYELATGFAGIGQFFEKRGIWKMVDIVTNDEKVAPS
jgi:hypothetical protein